MNVYDQIDANNRKTAAILCAFPVSLLGTVFLFSYLIVGPANAVEFMLYVYLRLILVAFVWIVLSYYKGDAMILKMAHTRRRAFEENRELSRLVVNTCIMAGLPVPEIYLIKDESINAFATGRSPKEASIAITDGMIEKLDKAELQAVIAHELAHIGNRDTRLMMIVIAGIGCFTSLGETMCRPTKGGSSLGLMGGVMIGSMCLVFGYMVAPILRFALSRRREFQADATAVKITRDPEALARALSKIAENPNAELLTSCPLAGNMYIANEVQAVLVSSADRRPDRRAQKNDWRRYGFAG